MVTSPSNIEHGSAARPEKMPMRLSISAFGNALGVFLAITFVLCVLFDLAFPDFAMNRIWAPLLPGFVWLSWSSVLIGLVESFIYGWYVAIIFVPLYSFFSTHGTKSTRA